MQLKLLLHVESAGNSALWAVMLLLCQHHWHSSMGLHNLKEHFSPPQPTLYGFLALPQLPAAGVAEHAF
jgi:hypothetical protein